MTVHQLFEKTALQPEDIKRLVAAYQRTLRALGLRDNDDPLTQAVAKKIIDIDRSGVRDPQQISELALRLLCGLSLQRRPSRLFKTKIHLALAKIILQFQERGPEHSGMPWSRLQSSGVPRAGRTGRLRLINKNNPTGAVPYFTYPVTLMTDARLHRPSSRPAGNAQMPNAKDKASKILGELERAEDELVGKAVVLTDGKAGTIESVILDNVHGLRVTIAGHDGAWPVSTIKFLER